MCRRRRALSRYTLTRRIFAIGADYDVAREDGTLAYRIDGKLRFAFRILIRDASGSKLVSVQEKLFALERDVVIRRGDDVIATMTKVFLDTTLTSTRHKFVVEVASGEVMEARGAFREDDWRLMMGSQHVAVVRERQRKLIREIYDVEISDGQNEPLVLAVVAAIIKMEPNRGEGST